MIFVTATDTNVGKTYTSNDIIGEAKMLMPASEIAYYKVAQSGGDSELNDNDLGSVKANHPDIKIYCSYFFDYPAAPLVAAELGDKNYEEILHHKLKYNSGNIIKLDKILSDFEKIKKEHKFVLVEGSGGLAVPLTAELMISDVAKALNLPTLIVARPDLGTINHSLLSLEHARNKGLDVLGIYFSNFPTRYIPSIHVRTAPEIISKFGDVDVYTKLEDLIPKLPIPVTK